MPCIQYQTLNLRAKALQTIEQANQIIREFQAQGFDLTLRQLFYQFVSRGLIANTQKEYKNLGSVVNDGRLVGLIDWETIVDRTRNLRALPHWDSPHNIVEACSQQFRYDLWENQTSYVEVWIEKDALIGVIEGVCNQWDVPFFSCRGYTSQSEMWSAAQRLIARGSGKQCTILHLGDHDPSGVDMTRDIESRLRLFEADVHVNRLALNTNQVRQYNPPPNPAKITDSRAERYIARYGRESWELDALDPRVIATLIGDALAKLVDAELLERDRARQEQARETLAGIASRWEDVRAMIDRLDGEAE